MPECRFLLTRFCPCTGRYRSTKNPCPRICFTVLCQRGVHMSSAEAYSEPYTTPNLVTYFAKSPILDVWQSFWLHLFSEALIKNEPLYFQSSIVVKYEKIKLSLQGNNLTYLQGSITDLREVLIFRKISGNKNSQYCLIMCIRFIVAN